MKRRIAVLAAAVSASVAMVLSAAATEAGWIDTKFGQGQFTAKVIPPLTILSPCTVTGVLSPTVTLKWRFPTGSSYGISNVNYYTDRGGLVTELTSVLGVDGLLPAGLSTTGPVSGVYTTTFSGGLLNGLLGGTYRIGLRAMENGWTSTLSYVTATSNLAGLITNCTVTVP